ncbi:M56 family metallopeptidase [Paenibacillus agaridevorans]|uniref:M56 family metallopeptidase n=1 Tax=Paenibacillus agaridevorans TaxID=171404 RepID=UPI001BE4CF90|nr:M56 family metallopeptidase [Paenibacillus agaridevorans]
MNKRTKHSYYNPEAILAFIFVLVCWILAQMSYSLVHQLGDVSTGANNQTLFLAVFRDIALNHALSEQLFNGFIIYLLIVSIYHTVLQANQRIKLQLYLKSRLDEESTAFWNYRYKNDGVQIVVVKESAFVAMSYGMWMPKIVISTGVLSRFDKEEVEAILLHELYHCKAFHPLQMSLLMLVSKGLAFVPLIKDMVHYYSIWTELRADRYAVKRMNSELPIGRVLLSLIKSNATFSGRAGVHFANEAVNYRIRQIIDPSRDLYITLTNRKTIVTSVIVLFVMSLFLIGNCLR